MTNSNLSEKSKTLYKVNIFFLQKMNNKSTCYQKNRKILLKQANEYYRNIKENLKNQARYIYRELKDVRTKYGRNRYRNNSKENKQKLAKNIIKKIICFVFSLI